MRKFAARLLAILPIVSCCTLARAGVMLEPAGASTNMGSFNSSYAPVYAIDQSGLAASYTPGVTDFNTFVTATSTSGGGSGLKTWYSQGSTLTGNFDFDLGGSFTIDALALWNDPQMADQGVNSFDLYADTTAAFSSPVLLGSYTALDNISEPNNFGQIFSFTPTTASFVRMTINSNHGSTFVTGMVEAAFDSVPEPASMGALAMAGLLLVRRRIR